MSNPPDLPRRLTLTLLTVLAAQDGAARYLIEAGAPPEKTLIGLSTYGRSFMLEDPEQYDIGAPVADAGKPGRFSQEPGFAAYFEVSPTRGGRSTCHSFGDIWRTYAIHSKRSNIFTLTWSVTSSLMSENEVSKVYFPRRIVQGY